MAEENTTDPVGQMSNFNSFIDPAKIEMEAYKPIGTPALFDAHSLPGGNNISNPTYAIKDGTSGSAPNFPVNSASQVAKQGQDKGMLIAQKLKADLNLLEDKNNYSKIYAYDAGKNGAFKARYKAYGQETFDKVGFHPLIDNETWFNANTTGWDDFKRMMTHSALPLLTQGFMDPIKSYASFFGNGGDITGDSLGAASYDELSAIGYSTKGGFAGFTTNLVQSAAYSVGILAEGAVEGALVGAAVGAAEGGVTAIPGAAIGGAAGFLKSLWRLPSALAKMTFSFGKMAVNLNRAAKLAEAKNLFVNASKSMGNFFNPLENTKNAAMNYVFKNPDDLTALARTAKTAGALWHDAKNLNMALSEGRLEGGMAENRVYEKLYNDHYNVYGEPPDDAKQQEFHDIAKQANLTNTISNSLLVFYSNKIAFPSITQAKFLKGLPKTGFGTVIGNVGKEYQLVYTPAKDVAEAVYSAERVSLGNAVKAFVKPKIYGRVALNYFKKNLVEGFQEVSQDALATATEEYYTNTYYDPAAKNFQYAMGTLRGGFAKQMSAQGFETFLSGFAMGSILQTPSTIAKYMSIGYNKYYKYRDNYDEYLKNVGDSANEAVDALNTMHKNGKYFFDPRLGNYVNQVLIGKKIDDEDTRTKNEIKDDEFTAFTSAVTTALRTGTFDLFLNNFAGYKQASPKDIEEAWNLEEGQGEKALQSIDKAINGAKIIANRYNEAKKKMKYLRNLSDLEPGTEEYKMGQLYNEAYEAGLTNLVYMQSAFDDNLGRLNNLYQDLGNLKSLQEVGFTNVANLVEPGKLNREIQMLQTEIEAAETYTDPTAVEQVARKKSLLTAMTNFQKTQDGLVNAFVNNEIIKQRKAELLAEDSSLTPDSAEMKVIDELIQEYEDNQTNPFLEYKDAFAELLRAYVGTPEKQIQLEDEIMKKGGYDSMFDALVDTHIIRKGNAGLIQYINLLNDPKGFYEHIERNFEWMKKLYNRKEQYYKDIVNSELTNIQRNEILNTLAAQGIYVDLEEFANWVENHDNLPSYFIDAPKGMIINEGSILYDEYIKIFDDAATLEDNLPSSKMTDKEIVDSRINEIEDERVEKLDQAKSRYNTALKKEIGYDEKEYGEKKQELANQETVLESEKVQLQDRKKLLEKSIKQLNSSDIIEVQGVYAAAQELGYITDELYQQAEEAVIANPDRLAEAQKALAKYDQSIPQQDRATAAFYSVILKPLLEDAIAEIDAQLGQAAPELIDPVTTKSYAVFQEELKAINDKYDGLIQNLKNDFRKQGINPDAVTEITVETPYEQMPQDLKDILDPLFAEHLEFIEISPTLAEVDPNQYQSIRSRWIESQAAVIRKYNTDKKAEVAERAKKLAEPPVLKFAPKGEKPAKITAQTSGTALSEYYEKIAKTLEDGEYTNKKNELVQLTPEDIENIKADLAALEGYIDARTKTYRPQSIAEEVVDNIVKNVINVQDQVVDVFDESGRKIGRRFADTPVITTGAPISATTATTDAKADIERRRQEELTELGQKQLTKGFNTLSEATKPEQVANAIVNIEQNKNQGARLSKEQEQQLSEAKAKLKKEGYEIVDYNIVRYGENTIVESVDFYNSEKDVLTEEQANAIESKINSLEKRGEEVHVDDLPSPVSRTIKPLIKKDGVMVQAAKVNTLIFESVEQAREAIKKSREAGNKKPNAADKINAKYDAELAALGTAPTQTTEVISNLPTRATKVAEQVDLEITGKDPFLYNRLEDETIQKDFRIALNSQDIKDEERLNFFMTAFEKKNYPAFRSKRKLKLLRTSLENNFTEENLVNTVQRLAYDESTIAGDNVDNLIRDFLTPDAVTGFKQITWDPNVMTEEAFNTLFHPATGIVTKLRQGIIDGQYTILSENVKVFDRNYKDNGITGELDLLAIDKDGNVSIIDIKTGRFKNWEAYGTGAKSDKQTYFRAQQSIYKNLFYNMTGIDVQRISLLPIGITTDLDGKILELGLTELTPEGEDTLELEYLPEVEAAGVTKIAPVEAAPTPTTVASTEDIETKRKSVLLRKEDLSKAPEFAQKAIAKTVEAIDEDIRLQVIEKAYEGVTASPIAKELGLTTEQVRSIRTYYGVPDIADKQDYQKWKSGIDAELAALEKGVTESKKTIPLSDPSKVSLEENLNKPIVYNGRLGKLILLDDGVFGVELDQSSKVTELSLVLEGLKASLEVELGEFGNPTQAAELKNTIAEVQTELDKQAQTKQIIELTRDLMPVKDGKLLLSQAGIFPINNITEVAQVTVINKEQYDAKFDDPSEKTATINGVKYTVNRNAQGNIVSLSYGVNDKAIADIEAETKAISDRIQSLRAKFSQATTEEKSVLSKEISTELSKINQLNRKRLDLFESNAQRTVSGGNANNLIFALNRLPNSFQKGHQQKKASDEKRELKEIASLSSASDAANKAMDDILGYQYPAALDKLFEQGVSKVSNQDLYKISIWAEDALAKLEELASIMYNNNEVVTDIFNQINAIEGLLNDLQLIKLTKNGQISKQQPKELKELFGPTRKELPNRPSVSEVQVPVGGKTEAVSRQATDEELSKLREKVRNIKTKGDELIGEISLEETKPTSPVVEEIQKTKDPVKLKEIYDRAIIQEAKNPGTVDLNAAKEAFDQRMTEIATVMDIENIVVDEPVLSKKDIGEALAGSTFLVSSFRGNKVYITNLKTGKGQWYNNSELVENFKKAPVEGIEMEKEVELTLDDVEDFKLNTETVNNTLEDIDALNAAAKSVEEAQTKGSFRNQLKNKNCNI